MKGTELQIQKQFMKLLNKYKIDEITVDLLCSSVHIRRQTFYYHYKNIYDLIYSIFYTKELKPTNPKNYDAIINDYLDFLFSDENFYRELNKSNARDVLVQFSISFLTRALITYLNRYKISNEDIQEIARYVSTSVTYQVLYYYEKDELDKPYIKKKIDLFMNPKEIEVIVMNFRRVKA